MDLLLELKKSISELQEVLKLIKQDSIEYYQLETQIVQLKLLFCHVRNQMLVAKQDN
jgi:hypothetical protein